jgi:hypothetical protein
VRIAQQDLLDSLESEVMPQQLRGRDRCIIPPHGQIDFNQPVSDKTFDFNRFTVADAMSVARIVSKGKLLNHNCVVRMLMKIRDILRPLPNICEIKNVGQVKVMGDTHGQLQDLLFVFNEFGYPSVECPYLFNGDYVDRGSQGLEILLVLFAFKIADSRIIYLNRGNQYV